MGVRKYDPTSPGRRNMSVAEFNDIDRVAPEKNLVAPLPKSGGRNNMGRITSRFRGGGHKRQYRIIDFKRDADKVPARVDSIQYDPNRGARLALLKFADGRKAYILAAKGMKKGDTVVNGETADIIPGNALKLRNIPVGTVIHNIELKPGKGGQMVRTAGSSAQLMAKEGMYALVRLPSGEVRKVLMDCRATVGEVSNPDHEIVRIGKAGRQRWLGRKPHNRGVVMNPVDHPHGGGEGRSPQGNPHPVTPWGIPTKGYKTRKNKRTTSMIVTRRKK